jgi:hypothetical protein
MPMPACCHLLPLLAVPALSTVHAMPTAVVFSAGGNRTVTLDVAGASAFRVGVSPTGEGDGAPLRTLMVPDVGRHHGPTSAAHWPPADGCGPGVGIHAVFGAVRMCNHTTTGAAILTLFDAAGAEIIRSALLSSLPPQHLGGGATPSCENSGQANTDKADGNRLKASTEDLQSDCCASCLAFPGCTAWIFCDDAEHCGGADNCWLMDHVTRTKTAPHRVFGRVGGGGRPSSSGAVTLRCADQKHAALTPPVPLPLHTCPHQTVRGRRQPWRECHRQKLRVRRRRHRARSEG